MTRAHTHPHAFTFLLALGLLLSALATNPGVASLTANRASDSTRHHIDDSNPFSASLPNTDGSLNLSSGFNGGIDDSGYRMMLGPNGAPRFIPAAPLAAGDEKWNPQFSGSGISHSAGINRGVISSSRAEKLITPSSRLGPEFLSPEGRLAFTRPLNLPGSFAGRRNEERFRMEDRR